MSTDPELQINESPEPDPALDLAIEEFRASDLAAQMHDAEESRDNCKPVALALMAIFKEHGVDDYELVGFGSADKQHYAVRVRGQIVDPSHRQFDRPGEPSEVPCVDSLEKFSDAWSDVDQIPFEDIFRRKLHGIPDELPDWAVASRGLGEWSESIKSILSGLTSPPTP